MRASVSQGWRRNWGRITPFFNYPLEIRKAIYTNSVDSRNPSLRKIIEPRGIPRRRPALKLIFLALRQAAEKWTMPICHWHAALNHLTILCPERMPAWRELHHESAESLHRWAREVTLPPHPSPKTISVHTEELTHLFP